MAGEATRPDRQLDADSPRWIRQGEFAVLVLMALEIPPPPGGWTGETAACFLSGRTGCEAPAGHPGTTPAPSFSVHGVPAGRSVQAVEMAGERFDTRPPGVAPESGWQSGDYLTEGVMVEILVQMGVPLITKNPDSRVSWELARGVLGKFQPLISPRKSPRDTPPSRLLAVHLPEGHPAPPSVMSPSSP